jgi:hypothetical protein
MEKYFDFQKPVNNLSISQQLLIYQCPTKYPIIDDLGGVRVIVFVIRLILN